MKIDDAIKFLKSCVRNRFFCEHCDLKNDCNIMEVHKTVIAALEEVDDDK